jgi:DNA-binding winged helix-turn-helix (wHTH) protein/Tol biopolymer transport system component
MSQQLKRLYTFGDFRLDCGSTLLIHKDQPVPLAPKVFDTLLLLVENAGRLVDKGEFMHRLWPDTFVGDDALTRNIYVLRKVLEETANGQEYIATVPKRGYRFVAEVQTIDEGRSRTANGSEARGRQKYLFLGFAMLLMTVYAAYRYWPPTKAPNPLAKLSQISHWNKPMNDARLSPDGRFVAFSSPVGRVDQIFVMPISGGEPLQLTREEGDKDLDGFSPDGTEIYYGSALGRDQEWAVPTLGGTPRRLVSGCCLAPFPDGSSLFYLKSHSQAVYRTERPGVSEEKVYSFDAPRLLPQWLLPFPNGNDLLVMAVARPQLFDEEIRLYKLNVSAGTAVGLGTLSGLVDRVVWAEPGKTVLLSRNVNGLINLWKYSVIDGQLTQLTSDPGPDLSPMRDPNTGGIYYVNEKPSGFLTVYHAHSKELVDVVAEDASQPIISPDRKRVVYVKFSGPGQNELWVSSLDGTNRMKLASSGNLFTGEWAPDSSRLSFFDNAGGRGRGYVVGADGQGLRSIGRFEEPIDWIAWSADATSLYVTTWKNKSERALWTASADGSSVQRFMDNACTVMDVSADGRYLLGSLLWGDGAGIYQISLSDKRLVPLLPDVVTQPIRFAPDSKSFLYAEFSRAGVTLYRQAWRDGKLIGKPQIALRLPFRFSVLYGGNALDFTRDLSEVVYGRSTDQSDLYLLSGAQ